MNEASFTPQEAVEGNAKEEKKSFHQDARSEIPDLPDLIDEIESANQGNQDAKEKFLDRFSWLIDSIIEKYFQEYKDEYYEDMIQTAKVAILKNLPRLDKTVNPTNYLSRAIFSDLFRWEHDNQNINIPINTLSQARVLKRLSENQYKKTGNIDYEEIRGDMKLNEEEFDNVIAASKLLQNIETLSSDELDENLEEQDPERLPKFVPDKIMLDQFFDTFFNKCSPREREIIEWRFGFRDGQIHSIQNIAEKFDVIPSAILQLERKAIKHGRNLKIKELLDSYDSSTADLLSSGKPVDYPIRSDDKRVW